MSHSYSQILVHGTFSTEERRNLIQDDMQPRLWAYISATAKKDGVRMISVGGIANHAHVLFALPPTLTLATVMRNLKSNSSRWMREKGCKFAWQTGYGAFSIGYSQLDAVVNYIRRQPEHHKRRSFEQEFLALLKKYGVDYDPKYVLG